MKNPECLSAFGLRLRKLREAHNISQQDLADKSDVNKKTIQKIELSRINPSLDVLASLANGLEMKLSDLLDFDY
ncbi:MAG: helix-turn-helix domain-containing protein [Sphingobacteriales bacterium JAD_PAG50586_3]|nr:MAG: helix-turn-helix domain-containing protein [Sphingobacteriales bacterium JAD_PAG50586_3]